MGGITPILSGAGGIVAKLVYDGKAKAIISSSGISAVLYGGVGEYSVTVAPWTAAGFGNGFVASAANGAAGYTVTSVQNAPFAPQISLLLSSSNATAEDGTILVLFW